MQKLTVDKVGGSAETETTSRPKAKRRWVLPTRRFVMTFLIAALGPLVAAGIGGYLYFAGGRVVTTDNAYVKADRIAISPVVSGQVVDVLVDADQPVRRGQVLFRIDPEFFQLALEKAEAELEQTKARVEALRAEYLEAKSELKEAEDRVQFYDAQRARQKQLADKGVGKAFVFEEADSNADAARARATAARQKLQRVLAQLGGDPQIKAEAHPLVREKIAARDRAKVELARTEVRAPVAGIVTNFDLQRGEYVAVGRVVFSLVGSEDTWVQANYKETELTYVQVGQKATVHVDTYPDHTWTGRVASISPATGSEFAILPPQNATGNWVKVVQRLPVRVRLEPEAGAPPLRAGMSVIVDIDTGHKRPMPRWATTLFGWAKAGP
ncbi:MAG: HlyD family secretion protein [Hyphomicrobiaceae bacterium]